MSAIEQFSPDAILTEVRPENPGAADGAIDGGIEQAIIYAYAFEKKIPVIPTDWFDDAFIAEMEADRKKEIPELEKIITPKFENYRQKFMTASLLELNSEKAMNEVRDIYSAYERFGLMSSRKRNDQIAKNIQKALSDFSGKRVLILYGMDHKYFIDDFVEKIQGNEVIPVASWFDEEAAKKYQPSAAMKIRSIQNLKASESLATDRIKNKFYSNDMASRVENKIKRFQKWADAINAI